MSHSASTLDSLLRRREQIRTELASIGDLRPGSLKSRFRRCGKPSCRCAREGHPGHGPSWFLSRIVKGKMHCRGIPAHALAETRRQVVECGRLRELTRELMEVSDRICDFRLQARRRRQRVKKGASPPKSRPRALPKSSD